MLLDGLENVEDAHYICSHGAWRLTLIVQDGRIYGRVVFIVCECKWGPLLKCRGSLHVVETLREKRAVVVCGVVVAG